MNSYYIGLDIHKRSISYCIKSAGGQIWAEGKFTSNRSELIRAQSQWPRPWIAGMEATIFSGWIHDVLKECGQQVRVGDPNMMRAIAASKKKSDQLDARKIADLLRADLFPDVYVACPQVRELRQTLRYRNLLVREIVRFKNRACGMLMEAGIGYERERVHGQGYWARLMEELVADEMPSGWIDLLRLNRNTIQQLQQLEGRLVESLVKHPRLAERVKRLDTIPGVGPLTALTWALEIDDPKRFANVRRAVSYCGLCSAQRQSGERTGRGPLSKQRNKHLQTMLVEAAKKGARRDTKLNEIYEREKARGNPNQATIAVARRLVAYLLACDRENRAFRSELAAETTAA